jgi:para-aminobenzoate synthetase component 1
MMAQYPTWVHQMDEYYAAHKPFLAIIAFNREEGQVFEVKSCADQRIYFNINGHANFSNDVVDVSKLSMTIQPMTIPEYANRFYRIQREMEHGNTYLLNLCAATILDGNIDLLSLFHQSKAAYRLFFKDEFIVFSPESFVKWCGDTLTSYPMKGTIDAAIPDAGKKLQSDEKEIAEHYTIVDLIRNDLGSVCDDIQVPRFAYLEEIETSKGPVLQMASEIKGIIAEEFIKSPGKLFYQLLPAGSISGAPKFKTLEIIEEVEVMDRGYYTGIMIHFDGQDIDSGVMIRFIEKDRNGGYWYKSGGGITHKSSLIKEYDELIQKIYLPFY